MAKQQQIPEEDMIYLNQRFHELLGKKKGDIAPADRKQRWDKWKELAVKYGSKDLVEYWMDTEACIGCKHLGKDAWCNLQELPCTVNPITTFQTGGIGMACMGIGFEENVIQAELFKIDI